MKLVLHSRGDHFRMVRPARRIQGVMSASWVFAVWIISRTVTAAHSKSCHTRVCTHTHTRARERKKEVVQSEVMEDNKDLESTAFVVITGTEYLLKAICNSLLRWYAVAWQAVSALADQTKRQGGEDAHHSERNINIGIFFFFSNDTLRSTFYFYLEPEVA